MSVLRFSAVVLIFAAVSLAWCLLGATMTERTHDFEESLSKDVTTMWGQSDLVQRAPRISAHSDVRGKTGELGDPLASDIRADFKHTNRYKGLLWFSTYTVNFEADYVVKVRSSSAVAEAPQVGTFIFPLPAAEMERVGVQLDGKPVEVVYSKEIGNPLLVSVPADGAEHTVSVAYEARGRDSWSYRPQWPQSPAPAPLRRFTLTATTNFDKIDYVKGAVSPVEPAGTHEASGGMKAVWKYDTERTSRWMGVLMPARDNSGPIAARMSFFAPVSLLFFFTVLFTVVVLKKIPLHPMHYMFISAAFFSFHILLAYLVDKISIHVAFWICSAVAVVLVVSYMRLVAGVKFAVVYVGAAQLVYLLGFSYAFFFPGWTGLTIAHATVCADASHRTSEME